MPALGQPSASPSDSQAGEAWRPADAVVATEHCPKSESWHGAPLAALDRVTRPSPLPTIAAGVGGRKSWGVGIGTRRLPTRPPTSTIKRAVTEPGRIHLEIEPIDGSFTGRATESGVTREFAGWLGLLRALELLLAQPPPT